jgi:hypothetical protein
VSSEKFSLRRKIALAFYAPVLAVLAGVTLVCLFLLVQGERAGLFAVLHGCFAAVLGFRAARIYRQEIEDAALWKDIAALGLAALLIVGLAASFLL